MKTRQQTQRQTRRSRVKCYKNRIKNLRKKIEYLEYNLQIFGKPRKFLFSPNCASGRCDCW